MIEMVKQAKEKGYKLFISPHYFYPHDHKWQFGGAGEHMMLEQQMFATIISSPHKIFGPESNDLALQLRKNGIDTVILGGMNGNLCSDSHMRELVESGFNVVVATDAIGAPGQEAMDAALTNFGFIADQVMTTEKVLEQLS